MSAEEEARKLREEEAIDTVSEAKEQEGLATGPVRGEDSSHDQARRDEGRAEDDDDGNNQQQPSENSAQPQTSEADKLLDEEFDDLGPARERRLERKRLAAAAGVGEASSTMTAATGTAEKATATTTPPPGSASAAAPTQKFKRPRGRNPIGKVWSETEGRWVDAHVLKP